MFGKTILYAEKIVSNIIHEDIDVLNSYFGHCYKETIKNIRKTRRKEFIRRLEEETGIDLRKIY